MVCLLTRGVAIHRCRQQLLGGQANPKDSDQDPANKREKAVELTRHIE